MPQVSWKAAANHRYWIDVTLGNRVLCVMVDVGLVDHRGQVGFEVDPVLFRELRQASQFTHILWRSRRDASARVAFSPTGLLTARLHCPVQRQPVGPAVPIYVSRGAPGVPSRVGVVFFHRLQGCRVIWDLDQRTWSVEYP
jgi:hypothetical protein